MAKRAKCPKCGCDAWSEKNQQCSACGSGWTPYPAQSIREHSDPNWAAAEAKARADAAGNRRQEKRSLHLGIPFRPSAEEERETTHEASVRHAMENSFVPSAEELAEQADGPAPIPVSDTVLARLAQQFGPPQPSPGEKCPTCNRKVPKRRKADGTVRV